MSQVVIWPVMIRTYPVTWPPVTTACMLLTNAYDMSQVVTWPVMIRTYPNLSLGLQWSQHACCPMSMTCPMLSLGLWWSGHISSLGLQWSQHVCCYPMIRTCSRLTLCLLWSRYVQSCHLACDDQDLLQIVAWPAMIRTFPKFTQLPEITEGGHLPNDDDMSKSHAQVVSWPAMIRVRSKKSPNRMITCQVVTWLMMIRIYPQLSPVIMAHLPLPSCDCCRTNSSNWLKSAQKTKPASL